MPVDASTSPFRRPVAAPPVRPLVCLPTFNNAVTLADVLRGALSHGARVLVVNDGSNDDTLEVARAFPGAVLLDHGENRGKGEAILSGFHYARVNGFTHVITMDTDGQHHAADLPRFFAAIEGEPDAVWLGDRGLLEGKVPHAPGSSVFGCRFSNFWVRLETGLALPDTQTGFRAYPLRDAPIPSLTRKRYDFEIEILVRFAWAGVPVRSLSIAVTYPPRHERVSHFDPWRDNALLSLLHTRLCVERLLSIPKGVLRGARQRALPPRERNGP